jgi:hypothetical protein
MVKDLVFWDVTSLILEVVYRRFVTAVGPVLK